MKIEEVRTNNIRKLLKKYGYPKLMDITGKSQSQISQWVNNSISSSTGRKSFISQKSCRSLEEMLKLPERWFDVPHDEDNEIPSSKAEKRPSDQNVVPLYDRPEWNEFGQPTEALDWYLCPIKHGPRTFALVVRDDSMYKPEHKHNLTRGDIVFVDPDETPVDGDYVLATSSVYEMTSIKQYKEQGIDRYLHTPNPEWQKQWILIDDTITIRGVITGKVVKIR